MMMTVWLAAVLSASAAPAPSDAESVRPFAELVAHRVTLKPELEGVHPRIFVTAAGLERLRERARTTHKAQWQRVLAGLPAMKGDPPPPPGPQARRSQNEVAFAIAGASLAYAVEQKPELLEAARRWTLAAIDYEPWGYTYSKPNVDLAAGHLLYAIGWAYDLLYHDLTVAERGRIRASLERHAALVFEFFTPRGERFAFTQNHDFIPNSGLAVAALALMGESKDAPRWAALARAHLHRTLHLLSPDGYFYEGFEYWIFSTPWLVHFLDAWEHVTGESFWERNLFRNWKSYVAHSLLPDGQNVFDFGDVWEGPITRARQGHDYARAFPGGRLESNYNVLYRVAARLQDPATQAVAERLAGFGHGNLEEYWTLLWRDATLAPAPLAALPLHHHFADSGAVFHRTSWDEAATALAFRAGPPQGHRLAALLSHLPDTELSSGHVHPDANSFILYAKGRYLVGDTGYAGVPSSTHHNTITVAGIGQGGGDKHDQWDGVPYDRLDRVRIVQVAPLADGLRVMAEASAAYGESAGLEEFTRELRLELPHTLVVKDHVRLKAPRAVQWYLHSDRAFEPTPGGARSTVEGVVLKVDLAKPECAKVTTGPTTLTAPGRPGSIEEGPKEERGYELRVETCPARVVDLSATLTWE
jgi:hypothetical protein